MGIAVGDYNLDGKLDIFKTHFLDDTSVLYRNDGEAGFSDVTMASGIGVETRYIGWGTGFADFDNSGLVGLAVVTGSVYPEIETQFPKYPLKTPRYIFRNLGDGRFEELVEEAGPGIAAAHCSRGCAFGDFDNDGDVDMVIINLNEPPSLLRNDVSNQSKWIKILLVGTKSNRSAIGSRVMARDGGKTQAQAVMGAVKLLLRQRSPPAFWPGRKHIRRPRGSLDEWSRRTLRENRMQSASDDYRRQRDREVCASGIAKGNTIKKRRGVTAPFQLRTCLLEGQLCAQLQPARITGGGDLTEVCIMAGRV